MRYAFLLIALLTFHNLSAQRDPLETGGPLSQEQAAYDVLYYGLTLDVRPQSKYISGSVVMRASVVHPMHYLVLDLDNRLSVAKIIEANNALRFERRQGQIWVDLLRTRQPGELIEVTIEYEGSPRIAVNAPWDGGFTWATTESSQPWIATTCQGEGADLWWPCKDHVSDEPDSMDLFISVPSGLVAACNGSLIEVTEDKGSDMFHWFISQPINIYNVALNIAPYKTIETTYESITGEEFEFIFYVLPEDEEKGKTIFGEFQEHMKWYEELLGPYPFRNDKYGVAQTPHLGMEHQSIIAYGANFSNGSMTGGIDWGYDALHHHELAHEWWGNVITCADWNDMWIHEGFAAYMQALYCETLGGFEQYYNYMVQIRRFPNNLSIAPRESKTANEIYQAPIYFKGAWILHTLRNVIGDEAFFQTMKLFIYPDEAHRLATDGSQCRFVTTDDLQTVAEEVSGETLDWFFEIYLRQPKLPVLNVTSSEEEMILSWSLPEGLNEFQVQVEIMVDGEVRSIDVGVGEESTVIKTQANSEIRIDPFKRILMEQNGG